MDRVFPEPPVGTPTGVEPELLLPHPTATPMMAVSKIEKKNLRTAASLRYLLSNRVSTHALRQQAGVVSPAVKGPHVSAGLHHESRQLNIQRPATGVAGFRCLSCR